KDNYPRLQQIKARWDPRNIFHHALYIRPPEFDLVNTKLKDRSE
ncbi:MAG: BBE domain-containing protein, partial [Burkholderiales bacterium]|nr:BBE domain-containing protein [Anaerolineae bacterium]